MRRVITIGLGVGVAACLTALVVFWSTRASAPDEPPRTVKLSEALGADAASSPDGAKKREHDPLVGTWRRTSGPLSGMTIRIDQETETTLRAVVVVSPDADKAHEDEQAKANSLPAAWAKTAAACAHATWRRGLRILRSVARQQAGGSAEALGIASFWRGKCDDGPREWQRAALRLDRDVLTIEQIPAAEPTPRRPYGEPPGPAWKQTWARAEAQVALDDGGEGADADGDAEVDAAAPAARPCSGGVVVAPAKDALTLATSWADAARKIADMSNDAEAGQPPPAEDAAKKWACGECAGDPPWTFARHFQYTYDRAFAVVPRVGGGLVVASAMSGHGPDPMSSPSYDPKITLEAGSIHVHSRDTLASSTIPAKNRQCEECGESDSYFDAATGRPLAYVLRKGVSPEDVSNPYSVLLEWTGLRVKGPSCSIRYDFRKPLF